MNARQAEALALERLQLLEVEAAVQRAALAATFVELQERGALAWGGRLAGWGFKLLAIPRVRWLITASVLSRLRRRWAR